MFRSQLLSMQFLAWLALAFAMVGDSALDHPHSSSHERGPVFVEASGAGPLCTTPLPLVRPDARHEEHSAQVSVERGMCGVCRSIEGSWLVGRVQHDATYAIDSAPRPDESSTPRWSVDPRRGHPPRAPPSVS